MSSVVTILENGPCGAEGEEKANDPQGLVC